jgi:hypothetical protein
MQFGDDERGAAIQIGAVLLFGMLIISMATYQATVVPNQNKEIEFNHNQEVQGQMQDLRNTVVSVPGGGNGGSVTLDLGTTYPSRTLFVNPGPPSGSLRTVGTNDTNVNVSVVNAAATDETGDFWNGDARNFTTGALVYEPRYHEYQNPPTTVYEHSLLYNQFRDENLTVSDQTIVNDRQITLVTLDGNLSEDRSDSTSVTARPISASDNTVAVEADGGPINITLPTRLDNDTWSEALREQYVSNGGHVAGQYYESVSGEPYGLLTIELEEGETYDLQMARVGVGSGASAESSGRYIVDVAGDGETVAPNENQTLAVEVRDRYNNPISGQQVNASVTQGGGTVTPAQQNTSSDGRATFTYEAGSTSGTAEIEANISTSGGDTKRVVFEVQVSSSGGGGGGGTYTTTFNTTQINQTQSGITDCSNDICVYDTTRDGDDAFDVFVEVTSGGDGVVGVDTEYAYDNSTVIYSITNLDPPETNETGEDNATVNVQGINGTADLYASTSEDGDVITIDVRSSTPNLVVAYGNSNQYLRTVDRENRVANFDTGSVEAVLTPRYSLRDGSSLNDVPYVNGSNWLILTNLNNETQVVVDDSGKKPKTTLIAVGEWNGSSRSLFYANSNTESTIYRVEPDEPGDYTEAIDTQDTVKGVIGIADFDETSPGDELIYASGSNNELRYITQDGTEIGTNIKPNTASYGRPGDFYGNGSHRIPVVTGDQELRLVNHTDSNLNQDGEVIVSSSVAEAPLSTVDWNEDGSDDVLFVRNGYLRVAVITESGVTVETVTDASDNPITVSSSSGTD